MRETAAMDKKAQGLSLNTIIIAIIVLIVLVVLIMVFTGYFGTKFTPGVTSCANSGGNCQFAKDDGSNGCGYDAFGDSIAKLGGTCPGEQICCSKGLGKSEEGFKTDSKDCGQEGKAPCTTGGAEPCFPGLEPIGDDDTCVLPCTSALKCVDAALCEDVAPGNCKEKLEVCCQSLS